MSVTKKWRYVYKNHVYRSSLYKHVYSLCFVVCNNNTTPSTQKATETTMVNAEADK